MFCKKRKTAQLTRMFILGLSGVQQCKEWLPTCKFLMIFLGSSMDFPCLWPLCTPGRSPSGTASGLSAEPKQYSWILSQ